MRHVIWDWNGTLVDDLPVIVDAVGAALTAIGETPVDADAYRDHYARPVRRFYESMLGRAISDREWEVLDRIFHETYSEELHRVPLTHDAWDAIELVVESGATQSILSMWSHDQLVPEVERHGLDRIMVRVDGNTGEGGASKAGMLRQHLENLGHDVAPVMIGDAIDDAASGIEVGIPVVLYDGGSHHQEDLEAYGVPVTSSLLDAVVVSLNSPGQPKGSR